MSIHTETENQLVRDMLFRLRVRGWIGLNDIAEEGNFVWSDGSPKGYTQWASKEPDIGFRGGRQDCTCMCLGKWRDVMCNIIRPFVCKYKVK